MRESFWTCHWSCSPFVLATVMFSYFAAGFYICWCTTQKSFFFLLLLFQIQNADNLLISPLERFRKEQIGAVKVNLQSTSRFWTVEKVAHTFSAQVFASENLICWDKLWIPESVSRSWERTLGERSQAQRGCSAKKENVAFRCMSPTP